MLQLANIHFRYRDATPWTVHDLTLSVAQGEVCGLLGPNGAGKTTLMSLAAGLLAPQQGRITRAAAVQARGGLALVPQEYAFYPMLSCRENLDFFAGVLGLGGTQRRQRIAAAIAATGLERVATKRASECSGGLKRRLNLAIALVGEPRLLLLDEPTVGVDPQSRAFLLDAVRRLRAEGRAIIYASHYMDEVQAVSDRIAILDQGKLLCYGALNEMLADVHGRLHVRLPRMLTAGERAELTAEWGLEDNAGKDGGSDDGGADDNGGAGASADAGAADNGDIVFHIPADGPRTADGVLAALRQRGLRPVNIQYGSRHLEDVFLNLTNRTLRD
jgi:ABC-2 type transport system ATP-binding protein